MKTRAPDSPSLYPGHNLVLGDNPELSSPRQRAFEPVPLETGKTLLDLGEVASHVYFPVDGVISVLSATRRGDSVEIAAIGREGVSAVSPMMGAGLSPFRLLVQVPGKAFRIDARTLLEHVQRQPALRDRMFRYLHVTVGQITQSAVCNRYHKGRHRLARWLLTVSDRAQSDVIPMTHEFAAIMVGDHRPRVTSAIRALRDRGLIRHRRGEITILDREGLMRESCECYLTVRRFFDELDGGHAARMRRLAP